jgi:hypothetical protein
MKKLSLLLVVVLSTNLTAQDTLRVLFLGNSYTAANNLPSIVSQFAQANGDVVITDMNTPGGHSLDQHATNATSLAKISQGNWDYVVLQDQSQVPTIDYFRYNLMYPAVEDLKEIISSQNLCAKTVMFMTWGRQNGGMQCSSNGVYCSVDFEDFSHMTDTLASAYTEIAEMVGAQVAPVGKAWDGALTNSTTDPALVLHSGDGSHPNFSGSYLAGAVFHGLIWDESPVGNTFTGSLNTSQATYLQESAQSTLNEHSDINQGVSNDCALIIDGNDFVYETSENFSFQWFDSDNQLIEEANSNTYNATISGTYTIEVSNGLGCTISCSSEIEVTVIEEMSTSWRWVNSSTLRISRSGKYTAQIMNAGGKLVYEKNFIGNEFITPNFSSGLYLLSIKSDSVGVQPFVTKFVR